MTSGPAVAFRLGVETTSNLRALSFALRAPMAGILRVLIREAVGRLDPAAAARFRRRAAQDAMKRVVVPDKLVAKARLLARRRKQVNR